MFCLICQQSCRLNEIYSFKVKKKFQLYFNENVHKDKVYLQLRWIWTVLCIRTIHHHEMFECPNRRILCPAKGCNFINNVETVIIYSISCPYNLLYCAICKLVYNVSVFTHDCNIIISQRLMFFQILSRKFARQIIHIKIFNRNNSYTETFEDRVK